MSLITELMVPVAVFEAAFDGGNNLLSGKSLARKSIVLCWLSDQCTGAVSSAILGSMDSQYMSSLRWNWGGVANCEIAG